MSANGHPGKPQITIVGAGIAGLVAAIACAEEGAKVRLLEAHEQLGGRARSTDGPYKANLGPHAIYKQHDSLWGWMEERDLLPRHVGPRLSGVRMRWQGEIRRTPPLGALPSVLRLRGREAPSDVDFRTWAARHTDETTAEMLSAGAGVYTFHHDPGELSAAFVWARTVRLLLTVPTAARYFVGGWSSLVASLERRVRSLGVDVQTSARVEELPDDTPVILATELDQARRLLGDESLTWQSGNTVCMDIGLRRRRSDPTVVSDLDEAGLGQPLLHHRPVDRARRRAADPGADADSPRGERRAGGAAPGAAARSRRRRLARARDLAAASGDGRALGRARPARLHLARSAGDRSRRRRVPGGRHGRRARSAGRGLLGERDRGQPLGARGGAHHQAAVAPGRLSAQLRSRRAAASRFS